MEEHRQPAYTASSRHDGPLPTPRFQAQYPSDVNAEPFRQQARIELSDWNSRPPSTTNSVVKTDQGYPDEEGHAQSKDNHHVDPYDPSLPKLPFKQRIHHFTWAWYTLTMSTGGLSLLIFAQPHQFPGLIQIGFVVYILNLIFFAGLCAMMIARFLFNHGDFTKSLSHPREGFFFPTFWLSVATIITSTERYAIPDDDVALRWAIQAAFWIYVIGTLVVAIGQYSFVFAAHSYKLHTMMPTWILPIFPIMLSGTIASVIAAKQPPQTAVPIVIAGMACQGLGVSVSVMMYSHMIGRLMQAGLPNREHRPGLFMNVGPPAFTALAFIGMANGLPNNFDPNMDADIDAPDIRIMALIGAVFLWSLSLWWFFIAALAVIISPPKHFHLGWWAMVFPNTGFTLATISIANQFKNDACLWVGTVMSIGILIMYFFVLYNNVRAVITQEIMYPGRDEDVEDH